MTRKSIVVFSPVVIIIICQIIPIIWGKNLGSRIFLPILLTYWILIGTLIFIYGRKSIKRWLGKPQGHWSWAILLILLGLANLPFFLSHHSILQKASLLIPHILFFLINPWLEEFYWRGLIQRHAVLCLYSNHSCNYGLILSEDKKFVVGNNLSFANKYLYTQYPCFL